MWVDGYPGGPIRRDDQWVRYFPLITLTCLNQRDKGLKGDQGGNLVQQSPPPLPEQKVWRLIDGALQGRPDMYRDGIVLLYYTR